MKLEDLIPVAIIVGGVLVKLLSSLHKSEDDATPDGGAGRTVTLDELKEVIRRRREGASAPDVPEAGNADTEFVSPVPSEPAEEADAAVPVRPLDPSVDSAILEEQRKLAALAAQAERQEAEGHFQHEMPENTEAEVYAVRDHASVEAADWSRILPEFLRDHPQTAIAAAEILAPPVALRR